MGLLNKLKAGGGAGLILFAPKVADYGLEYVVSYVPQGAFMGVDNTGLTYILLTAISVGVGLVLLYDV